MFALSNQSAVSPAAMACPQFTYNLWLIILIQIPWSERRQRASEAPGITGISRNIRCSTTAFSWSFSKSLIERPHSSNPQLRSRVNDFGSTPNSFATISRKIRLWSPQTPSRSTPSTKECSIGVLLLYSPSLKNSLRYEWHPIW